MEGGGQRGHILVSEGRNGVRWRIFASEVRLVVNFFQSFFAAHSLLGVGKSVGADTDFLGGGRKRLFIDVLQS